MSHKFQPGDRVITTRELHGIPKGTRTKILTKKMVSRSNLVFWYVEVPRGQKSILGTLAAPEYALEYDELYNSKLMRALA